MASPPGENSIECGDRVSGSGHGDCVERFKEARGGGQERGIEGAAGCGDDLTATARYAVRGQ